MLMTANMLILRILGGLFLGLGAIGLFLPLWPTTIFWILAAVCFARSSPATRDWIYRQPGLGPTIEDFIERGTLSRAAKIAALLGMTLAGTLSAALLWSRPFILYATLALLAIVAAFVATRKSA